MAKFEMKYRYNFGSAGNRYYGSGTPGGTYDIGLEAFVVDHLNKTRQQLILDMSNMRRRGEGIVRAHSRVDTGRMKSMVMGTGDFGTDVLKISFGWESLRPYYAPFQEYGTRRGIQPMMAVLTAYNTTLAELRSKLGGN